MAMPAFDMLGHKIFYLLQIEDILNCRKVCRQFKVILNDPYLWLKLLKFIGHSEQCHKKWIDLIQKSNEIGIVKERFVNVLIQKTKNPYGSDVYERKKKWVFAMPPIYNAVKIGDLSVVKAIAHYDKDFFKPLPNYFGDDNWTAFTEAAENGHFEIAEFIESQIQTQELENKTRLAMKQVRSEKLIRAIKSNKIVLAKFLSEHIENPLNCTNRYEIGGPLHIAADFGYFELLEYFAHLAGDDIHNITDDDGRNIFAVALKDIGYGDKQRAMMVLNILMKYDPNRATPLHHAAQMGFLDVCKMYQRYIDVKDRNGDTPLHYVASSTFKGWDYFSHVYLVIEFLISISRNPSMSNSNDQTPLHIAIAHSNTSHVLPFQQVQLISLFAKTCRNLNIQDSQGWTPLHYAVSHYNKDMFEEVVNLIDCGLSVNVLDNEGMKPLDIALEDCNEHAVRILAPLTEDLNIAEETRNHPAYNGNEKFLACLQIIDQQRKERETLSNTNE